MSWSFARRKWQQLMSTVSHQGSPSSKAENSATTSAPTSSGVPNLETDPLKSASQSSTAECQPTEVELVQRFRHREPGSLEPLIQHFNNRVEPFVRRGNSYYGEGHCVRVENDLYFYTYVGGGTEYLDGCPAYYGLTYEQAKRLDEAILSCVPVSTFFVDKQKRQGRMIQE